MTHPLQMLWNPSEGIDLGFFMIRYYSLMFVVAFGLGWYIMKKIFDREGEPIDKLDSLFIWTAVATLIGARLGHVLFYQPELFSQDILSVFLPFRTKPTFEFTGFSGLASHGAAVAIVIAMVYVSRKIMKRPLLWVLDRVVITVASGAVFVRLGNFMNSEILGDMTTSKFGIRFLHDQFGKSEAMKITGMKTPKEAYDAIATNPKFANFLQMVPARHPAQLYEAFCYIFVFLILFYAYWRTDARLKPGLLFGLFMILLWSVRFFVEFLKESQDGWLESTLGIFSDGQWLSIPFIIIGIVFVARARKYPNAL
ncbi:prolipoprotein diacylglyceryl transferase [Flavobacterium sp. 3HN19-14]|uniref:prolipoprotein diacylglyceryl transferase n=1 Tax=Flavobacterium sp. 3HN19-14 TaxID=3448133 RepID=UPI003EDE7FC2